MFNKCPKGIFNKISVSGGYLDYLLFCGGVCLFTGIVRETMLLLQQWCKQRKMTDKISRGMLWVFSCCRLVARNNIRVHLGAHNYFYFPWDPRKL